MHALVQSVETLVMALAVTAFAHFGVTLKQPPCPPTDQAVRRIPASVVVAEPLPARAAPCPLARDARQA
jgi:hypothetical protein